MDAVMENRIVKIQMLLALGTSSNKNEAEAALSKAQELMLKFKLSQAQVDSFKPAEDNPMAKVSFVLPRKRRAMQDSYVLWLLNDFYSVHSVYSNGYESIRYTFLGRQSDVEVAEYLYHFITRFFDTQWESYCKDNPVVGAGRRKDHKSFYYGVYEGIKGVLKEGRQRVVTEMGLVPVDESKAIEQYVGEQFPRLRSATTTTTIRSTTAREAGQAAGRSFTHTRGVSSGKPTLQIGG